MRLIFLLIFLKNIERYIECFQTNEPPAELFKVIMSVKWRSTAKMMGLEEQERGTPERIIWCKPLSALVESVTARRSRRGRALVVCTRAGASLRDPTTHPKSPSLCLFQSPFVFTLRICSSGGGDDGCVTHR